MKIKSVKLINIFVVECEGGLLLRRIAADKWERSWGAFWDRWRRCEEAEEEFQQWAVECGVKKLPPSIVNENFGIIDEQNKQKGE